MIKTNDNQERKRTPRDDGYLIAGFAAGIGLLGTAIAHEAWPLLVGVIVGGIACSAIVVMQIIHEHKMQATEVAGDIEIKKIHLYGLMNATYSWALTDVKHALKQSAFVLDGNGINALGRN